MTTPVVRVQAHHDWERADTVLLVMRVDNGQEQALTPNGWVELVPSETVPALARIPDWLMPEVRSALGQSNNAALEEALRVERARVDKVLEWHVKPDSE